jgi:hypothetical protein
MRTHHFEHKSRERRHKTRECEEGEKGGIVKVWVEGGG